MNLLSEVRTLLEPALAAVVSDPAVVADAVGMVKPAADSKNGDYQANAAMSLGKKLGRKPQEIAADIVAKIPANDILESATVAGPGFINLKLRDDWLAARVREIATDPRLGVPAIAKPRKYIVEYSSPNVAKPLHVGHLRSSIIGDALARLLKFLGHEVITDNHLGDWGTQFGILIHGYRNFLDEAAYAADPVRELARLYVHVRSLFKKAGEEEEENLGGTGFRPVQGVEEHLLEAGATQKERPDLGGTGFQPVQGESLSRRNLPHIQHTGATYHVIFRTQEISLPEAARQIVLDACLFWQGRKADIVACVIMPDHVHLLLTPMTNAEGTESVSLSEILHSIKSFSARKINELLGRTGKLWLEESYDRYIRSEPDLHEKVEYIRNNPVKDGLCNVWTEYRFLYLKGEATTLHRLEAGATQTVKPLDPVKTACQIETAKLHAGDPENLALWHKFMPDCLEAIHRIYRRLGMVPFDHELGESFYNPMMPGVVEELLVKGEAVESQGAIVIPNAAGKIPQTAEELKKEDPPALIRKRDGAFTYTTSDLATIRYRMQTFQPDAMLYAVDFRQSLHFKTLFAAAKRWGYTGVEMQHVSFGSVLGPDGKPLKSRDGGVPELSDLIDGAVQHGLQKYRESYDERKAHGHEVPELTDATQHDIAEAIGIGAVKYADLGQNRTSDYRFDYAKMLATEGNTATYMQYAYARCRSIFRKGDTDEVRFRSDPPAAILGTAAERSLALQLLRLPEALDAAAADCLPHLLTAYLWDLAKAFSVFFEKCPVLTAESPELHDSRLLLVDLTGRIIRQALDLLGIRTVERM